MMVTVVIRNRSMWMFLMMMLMLHTTIVGDVAANPSRLENR